MAAVSVGQAVEVVGGVVLGWIGSWFLFALVVLVTYSSQGDGGSEVLTAVLGVAALFVIPVLLALVLLVKGRQALGSGVLLGVAIGSVVGAGVCTTAVLTGL